MQKTLVITREDLLPASQNKSIEDIQARDMPYTSEQSKAEVIWVEVDGRKKRIKDRENALDGVILETNVEHVHPLPASGEDALGVWV